MVIPHPNGPKFACQDCGHTFGKPTLMDKIRQKPATSPKKCPKCGSTNIGRLVF